MVRTAALVLLALVIFAAGWIVFMTLMPIGSDTLTSEANATTSREEALGRWAAVQARDDETIDPRCESWSLLHDEPVETTVVLLHGYTNCPFMWQRLGNELHEQGWNVIAPRFPSTATLTG